VGEKENKPMTKPVYRMSVAGKCPRALSAQELGYEAEAEPTWLERAAEEGNWHERRIKDELVSEEATVYDEQLEVVLDYPAFTLIGHIDGKVAFGNDASSFLLEIKSMSQFEFDRWMRQGFAGFPEYAAQLTCYMTATGIYNALYIVKNRNSGYEDRRTITKPPVKMEEVIQRLSEVEKCVADHRLAAATFDPQAVQCQRCSYQHLCVVKTEIVDLDTGMLDEAVSMWRKGKALTDEGEALIDNARLTLGAYARKLETRKFVHDSLAVQLLLQHRVSYDKKLLEEHVPADLLEKAKKEQDIEQLRINDLKERE
jgi:CRISPR/Cas system-associated exonuclease Cas4 (RecB family)